MWTERDRRLAQVLLQAKVVSADELHRIRDLQEVTTDSDAPRQSLSELLLERGLLTEEKLRKLERSAQVPCEPPAAATGPKDPRPRRRRSGTPKRRRRRPRAFGNYDVIGAVASGASGTVYKARDKRTGELIALKVLSAMASEKRGAERFVREAKVACALRHENLVEGYEVGRQKGVYFLAMELVEGESAGQRLRREGRLPEEEVVAIGRACCRALECARQSGIVHRDVKPDNILIDTEGNVKLCDLGLARPFGRPTNVTESGIAVGTPRYISPEQAKGDPRVDHRADVYSLGITLFHLVTGKVPFDGPSGLDVITKHIYEEMPSIREGRSDLSLELDFVIRRATRKRPNRRYETAGDMGRDLDVIAARLAVRSGARNARRHHHPDNQPQPPA